MEKVIDQFYNGSIQNGGYKRKLTSNKFSSPNLLENKYNRINTNNNPYNQRYENGQRIFENNPVPRTQYSMGLRVPTIRGNPPLNQTITNPFKSEENPYSTINHNPGPGQYNDRYGNIKIKNPSWKIGTSQRDDELKRIKREGVPGPGMYEFDDRTKMKAPEYAFGHEKRGKIRKSETPGPGQYKIPCSFDDVNEYTRQQGIFDKNFKFV